MSLSDAERAEIRRRNPNPGYRSVHWRDGGAPPAGVVLSTSFGIHGAFAPYDSKHVYVTVYDVPEGENRKLRVDAVINEGETPPWATDLTLGEPS